MLYMLVQLPPHRSKPIGCDLILTPGHMRVLAYSSLQKRAVRRDITLLQDFLVRRENSGIRWRRTGSVISIDAAQLAFLLDVFLLPFEVKDILNSGRHDVLEAQGAFVQDKTNLVKMWKATGSSHVVKLTEQAIEDSIV